jgi:L-methionine (R)-S-oxide reductase
MPAPDRLENRYRRIYDQLVSLVRTTENPVSRMATIAALLHHKMPHFSWTGFYILREGDLTVGPYQGPVACQVLAENKGVCWAGILRRSPIIVPDVHRFPGHIACDNRSNSEIVIPLLDGDGNPWSVLDVDSRKVDAFSDVDRKWLQKIVTLIPPPGRPSPEDHLV